MEAAGPVDAYRRLRRGEVVPSLDGATMPVIDPATGERVATAAAGSAADVERAVRSARAAFDDGRWRNLPPLEQERRLRTLATLLAERADEFAELDVIDSGLLRMYAGFIVTGESSSPATDGCSARPRSMTTPKPRASG